MTRLKNMIICAGVVGRRVGREWSRHFVRAKGPEFGYLR
jgi:hypothetical protein